jgi:isoleucyl-tRNA synthetase
MLIVSKANYVVDLDCKDPIEVTITKTAHHKCGRCWRHLPEVTEDGTLCGRCEDVVNG